jgi:hypothetical protein
MELLKTDFIKKGVSYLQLKRTESLAIYEVQHANSPKGYEVFKIKVAPAHTWPNGKTTPEHESYPGDNAFGKTAWYYPSLELAEKRFQLIASSNDHSA